MILSPGEQYDLARPENRVGAKGSERRGNAATASRPQMGQEAGRRLPSHEPHENSTK